MRTLLLAALLAISAHAGAADWIRVEERADGMVLSYDRSSVIAEGQKRLMWHEMRWPAPRDCTAAGCVRATRVQYIYDCPTNVSARVQLIELDDAGAVIGQAQYKRLAFAPAAPGDKSDAILYAAACAPPNKRHSS